MEHQISEAIGKTCSIALIGSNPANPIIVNVASIEGGCIVGKFPAGPLLPGRNVVIPLSALAYLAWQ